MRLNYNILFSCWICLSQITTETREFKDQNSVFLCFWIVSRELWWAVQWDAVLLVEMSCDGGGRWSCFLCGNCVHSVLVFLHIRALKKRTEIAQCILSVCVFVLSYISRVFLVFTNFHFLSKNVSADDEDEKICWESRSSFGVNGLGRCYKICWVVRC